MNNFFDKKNPYYTTLSNLEKRGFDTYYFQDLELTKIKILSMITNFNSFGFPGSHTTRSLGLIKILKNKGKIVYDHWNNNLSSTQIDKIRLNQCRCDCLLCSANAISSEGEIINIDGVGNRIAGSIFGNKKVIIIAGINKIVPKLKDALDRVKNVAAPMRAKSLKVKTPCVETGECSDCNAPQRICRITSIMHYKPIKADISVFIVNKNIGF